MHNFIDFSMTNETPLNKPITAPWRLPNQTQQEEGRQQKKPGMQLIPTKPIMEEEPPRFIVPLYPSSKWGVFNPELHAKWNRERVECIEENLMNKAISKSPPGPGGPGRDMAASGVIKGKGGNQMKKPLKVIKVIKRAQCSEDSGDDQQEPDGWGEESIQHELNKQGGKGKMNQAVLDKMIKDEKIKKLNEKGKGAPLNPAKEKAGKSTFSGEEWTSQEENQSICHQGWGVRQEEYYNDEQWEMMEEENAENEEMEWEDPEDF